MNLSKPGDRPCVLGAMIHPQFLAFDIDGVVADTMAVFVRLARERYGLADLTKEHLNQYDLYRCLPYERGVIEDLICLTLDDEHTLQIPPLPGAPEVLTEMSRHTPLRFVTARIWPESITQWLYQQLPEVPVERIQVVATGAPEAKLNILRDLGIRYFVEDRLETCRALAQDGIQPLLFDQPWNRSVNDFPRLESWRQLRRCLHLQNGNGNGG
jgi:5'(3')-deoxyribonucleotidase